jgi:putative SOS response-associated peptidase YedK
MPRLRVKADSPTSAYPIEGQHRPFGFMTTEPNGVVAPVHAKAMPVILRQDEWEA